MTQEYNDAILLDIWLSFHLDGPCIGMPKHAWLVKLVSLVHIYA